MTNHFNLEANIWDTPEKIEWSIKYATRINELIPPFQNSRSILDFGCGTGLLSYSIAKDPGFQ